MNHLLRNLSHIKMSTAAITKNSRYTLNNGRTIPITGFGVYQTPASEATTLVYEALKVGYRHIDSARIYHNEEESVAGIAQFLKEFPDVKREDIFYTTKIWNEEQGYETTKIAIESSLERAKDIQYIDLFLIHSSLTNKEKRLGTYKALQEAVATGKVKSIGVSNYGTHHLDELFAWEGLTIKPVVNQVELHPWLPRKDLQEYAKKHDFYLEAYTPLTQGKKFDDPELVAIAKKHGYSVVEVLLRWSYDQGFIPLAKTATVARIKPNFDVLDHVVLDAEDLKILDKPDSYEVLTWDPTKYEG